MNKSFCQSCGKATEFTYSKPTFCAWCGTPFEQYLPKTANKPKQTNAQLIKPETNLDFELEDEDKISPEFEVEIPVVPSSKITIGQLIDPKAGPPKPITSNLRSRVSTKKLLAEFQKEAGAIKPRSHPRGKKVPQP